MVNLRKAMDNRLVFIYDKLVRNVAVHVVPNDCLKEINRNTNLIRINSSIASQCRLDLAKIKRQEIKL